MKFVVMTLFPDMMENIFSQSIIGRAQASGAIRVECVNIRDYSKDKHKKTDDTPYGGGRGMIMTCQPIVDCHTAIKASLTGSVHTVYMSPQGKTLTQQKACELSGYDNLIILCGHYEGVDERALEMTVDEEISIGDYVLTGGELPAAVLVDCVARTVDGVLVSEECYKNESHYNGFLEYPQYTKPYEYEGRTVPDILLSGHHENIDKWRYRMSLERTAQKRPDMAEKFKENK